MQPADETAGSRGGKHGPDIDDIGQHQADPDRE
jgi:hypothetical protein